jgi:G3E family GTPase
MLHKLNPAAPILRSIRGQVDLKHIIGIGAYSSSKLEIRDHDDPHGSDCGSTHYEVRGISSLRVACPVLTLRGLEKLDEWIRTVLWENRLPEDVGAELQVLRCKGVFNMETGQKYVLQGVRNLYEISEVEGEVVGIADEGKLVLIGKGLTEQVRRSLVFNLSLGLGRST